MTQANYRPQRGVSLVEASIALACFGLLLILIIATVQRQDVQSKVVIQDSASHRVQAAITAFAAMHGRLPCPAVSADLSSGGEETCSITEGYVPVKTLGLPMLAASQMRYKVRDPGLQTANSRDALVLVTTGLDLFKTMQPKPLKEFVSDANRVGVREQNFCQALFDLGAATGQAGAAAYYLQADASAQGESHIQQVAGSSLWAALNCNQVRAHGLRANANVLAGMEFLRQSYDDRLKVWGSDAVAYNLDAVASATWAAQATEKLFRQSGNLLAAEGVITCPYCAPSGLAMVPALEVAPQVILAQAPLLADVANYALQATTNNILLGTAIGFKVGIDSTVQQTTSGYQTALSTGARY